jgi:stearoyl-CoA desaturase (delta-9 desaturase)
MTGSPTELVLPRPVEVERVPFKVKWPSVVFVALITVATLVLCPIYVRQYGLTNAEIAFFAFYTLASSLSINFGYHRLFSHAAFRAAWAIRMFVLFFGGAAFQKSAMAWAALHRLHHRYTDTDRDPYNIKRGFFYAHVGWVLVQIPRYDYSNIRDLAKDPLVVHQDRHYKLWSHLSGLVIPLLIGAWIGGWTYAILFPLAARIFIVMNSVFCINSVSHTFGSRAYDLNSSARDHWLGVILTNGDGFHNYHHRFPRDYRHGIRWYHYDPTKWLISLFSLVGLASELQRTPEDMVRRAEGRS